MEGTLNVTPLEGVVINNNDGTIIFPQNTTTSAKTYNITYTDNNGCTGTTSYTINGVVTTYSYTVYSDVEGASVSWSNGSTGTISQGYCEITASTNNSLTVTLTKNLITFLNNGATCQANGSVSITNAADYVIIGTTTWSIKNESANKTTDIGETYKWGAISECQNGEEWTDGTDITTSRAYHDVVYIRSGNNRGIPSVSQLRDLFNYNQYYSLTLNGVSGVLIVDNDNHSMFMPDGDYWSANAATGSDEGNAEYLRILEGVVEMLNEEKSFCKLIRPIKL